MALITVDDIYSRIYEGNINEITRDDGSLITRAIDAAITEVKMYLGRYDLVSLFGTADTDATVTDTFLRNLCVDVAVWRLVLLGNANISYEVSKDTYEMAVKTLKDIQKGIAAPDAWPYRDTTDQDAPNGDSIEWTSNEQVNFHF